MIYIEMHRDALKRHLQFVAGDTTETTTKKKLIKIKIKLERLLENRIDLPYNSAKKTIYEFLIDKIADIATLEVNEFEQFKLEYDELVERTFLSEEISVQQFQQFQSEVCNFFHGEYINFTRGRQIVVDGIKEVWSAYKFIEILSSSTCSYCNANYTLTIIPKANLLNKVRPELDHFWAKSEVPIFSISLYNLVPSCKVCNQSLKHDTETNFLSYFSPYDKEISNAFYFSRAFSENLDDVNYVDSILGEKDSVSIKIQPNPNKINMSQQQIIKIQNNINLFRLEDVYSKHINVFQREIVYARIYNNIYINNLFQDFSFLDSSDDYKSIFLRPFTEHKNYIFSKAMHDILTAEVFQN